MRRFIACISVTGLVLALGACGDDDDVASTNDEASADDCSGPPEVTVNNAGDEPHQVMELSPTVGDTMALDIDMTTDVSAQVDGETQPTSPVPPMTLGMEVTVDDVGDDEVVMSFVYDKAEVDGGDPAAQGMLDTMVGASGTITTTRSGAFVDGDFAADDLDPSMAGMLEQFEQQMSDLTIPLPTEPVGVGAAWDVVSTVDSSGIQFCNTASYELVEFDGDEYVLGIEVAQQAVPGTTEEGGATVEVVEGSGSGSGQTSGSLSLPMAVSSSMTATTNVQMNVQQGDSERSQEISAEVGIELTPRE